MLRAVQVKVQDGDDVSEVIAKELNSKEFKRTKDVRDNYDTPVDPLLTSLRVIRHDISYPNIENNYPEFFK